LLQSSAIAASILGPVVLERYRAGAMRMQALPQGAQEILSAATNPNIDVVPFIVVVQRDQAVVGELTRIANSAVYRGFDPVTSVRDAVIRMGLEESTRIASMVASRSLFQARSQHLYALAPPLWDELSLHGLATAYGAAWLTKRLKVNDPAVAFMAGLFHNIGRAVVLHILLPLIHEPDVPIRADEDTCRLVCDRIHHEVGSEQLLYFNMPPEVVSVCEHASDLDLPGERVFTLHHVVRLVSGLLALEQRKSEQPELQAIVAQSITALKLPKNILPLLHQEMLSLADKVRVVLNQPVQGRAPTA